MIEKKYKSVYDKRKQEWKKVPDITIPMKYKTDIEIEDLYWDFDIIYCNIPIDHITEYIGLYHMLGEKAFDEYGEKYKKDIIRIYNKEQKEIREVYEIIKLLLEYTITELRSAVPELIR